MTGSELAARLVSKRRALLHWYDRHARDLPWRRTRDPYAIWVSEVMLQQTRVDTVLRYYGRFLERFPDTHALASASEDAVLAAWSGLGYYRRARLLHQGVREVVASHGGQVPEDPGARRSLPGVGRYTAGAIGSIAFDRVEPLVDGNVARVLTRACGIDTPLGRADTERALWSVAERWVAGPRPGALNQALMELGACVCTKHAPQCEQCPLQPICHAHRNDRVHALPVVRVREAPRPVPCVAVLAQAAKGQGTWLVRAERGLFAGLWNLPMLEGTGLAAAEAALEGAGLRSRAKLVHKASLEHVLTHRRLQVDVWHVHGARSVRGDEGRWVQPAELTQLGISALTLKCLGTLR